MTQPRGVNVEPIAYESRLNRLVQRTRLNCALASQLAEFARETDQAMPTRASLPGDPAKLRGIPALGGRGSLGSHIRGSLPHVNGLGERQPVIHELAVLVRDDGNGVSPGTDPVEALLDAEAETERLFRVRQGKRDRGAA